MHWSNPYKVSKLFHVTIICRFAIDEISIPSAKNNRIQIEGKEQYQDNIMKYRIKNIG